MPRSPGIHPREAPRPARSHGEILVWNALSKGMPAGWSGWHSLRIRDRDGLTGEGDFVLAHPERGLLVLEVKGGRMEQRDGRWLQNGTPLQEFPLDQGNRYVRKLVHRLGAAGCTPPAYGVAVCFPDTHVAAQPSQDDLAGLLLGRDELPWMKEALLPVVERALPAPRASQGRWIDALHELWGEIWVPALGLGTRAREALERRLALDPDQIDVLDGLLENERVLVRGGAGSGKTLVAAEAARRLAAEGRRVLFLCFTAPLQKWLVQRLAGTGVEVHTVSALAKGIADAAGRTPPVDRLEGADAWGELYGVAADHCDARWDVLVVDEAQDLQWQAWLLVSTLASGRRLYAFHDPDQAFWEDREPPRGEFPYLSALPRQLRGTPGLRALSDRILSRPFDRAALSAARADGTVGIVTAPSASSVPGKVGAEVDRLLSAGVELAQIGIVSLRGQLALGAIHTLPSVGRHPVAKADDPAMEASLVVDTFLRWKGLERPAIVVADLPEEPIARLPIRLNVALTRSMALVRFVGTAAGLARSGVAE